MAHDLIFGETKRDFGRGSVGAGTPENTTLREVLASTKKDVKEGAARGVAPVQKVLGITSRRGLVKAGVVTALGIGVLSLIVSGVVVSFIDGGPAAAERKEHLKYQIYLYFTADSQPDELLETPNGVRAPVIRTALDFLKKRRWNLFANAEVTERYLPPGKNLPCLPQAARGEVMYFENKNNRRLTVEGWATDADGTGVVGGVILEIDGKPYPVCYGLRFDEATRIMKNNRVMNSGFVREFSVRALGKGGHLLRVKVLTKDRSAFFASPAPTTFHLDE